MTTVNLRYSSAIDSDNKQYVGGPPINTSLGIFSPGNRSVGNLFDDVLKQENIDGTPDYRCLYVKNDSSSNGDTIYQPQFEFISATNTAEFEIGLAPLVVDTVKNTTAESLTGAKNEKTPPSNISWISLTTANQIVDLIQTNIPGTTITNQLTKDEHVYFWLKRKPKNIGGSTTTTGTFLFNIRYRT